MSTSDYLHFITVYRARWKKETDPILLGKYKDKSVFGDVHVRVLRRRSVYLNGRSRRPFGGRSGVSVDWHALSVLLAKHALILRAMTLVNWSCVGLVDTR